MEFEQGNWFQTLVGQVFRRLVNYFLFTLITLILFGLVVLVMLAYYENPARVQTLGDTVLPLLLGVREMIVIRL